MVGIGYHRGSDVATVQRRSALAQPGFVIVAGFAERRLRPIFGALKGNCRWRQLPGDNYDGRSCEALVVSVLFSLAELRARADRLR